MFVYNNIYNFEGRLRKHINDFTMRIGSSSNVLIATLRENSFILSGPLRQKWITSVYTIYRDSVDCVVGPPRSRNFRFSVS